MPGFLSPLIRLYRQSFSPNQIIREYSGSAVVLSAVVVVLTGSVGVSTPLRATG